MAKKGKESQGLNLGEKMRRVKILQETNRIKEAIAYIFLTFTEVLKDKWGPKVWRPSLTMRELGIRLVKSRQAHMDPEKIYPFITHMEQVLYGGEPATEVKLEETKDLFKNLVTIIKNTEAAGPETSSPVTE